MCGISGWQLSQPQSENYAAKAEALLDALNHRGPDARGSFFNKEGSVFLGHNRLSIIDLSELGTQPMTNTVGDAMVFNGEIYNYKTLRQELQILGHSFKSDSDSEVLLNSYSEWGSSFTDKIIGMYAIAIWNSRENTVQLYRDPTGIKPLYYWKLPNSRGIIFASELRAFCSFEDFKPEINKKSLQQYIEFGYTFDDEQCIFQDVYKVPPGTRIELKNGAINAKQQFYTPPRLKHPSASIADLEQTLFETLDQVVQEHFVADVPVGLLLSGGLDSSLIGALASRHQRIHTFSMGFENTSVDERPFARLVSEHINSHHTELQISPLEITNDLESVVAHYDDIFADWGMVSTRLLYKKCQEHDIKVVLVGEGSDELFGGYYVFKTALHGQNLPMEWRIFQLYRHYAGRRYGQQYFNFRKIFKEYLAESNGDMFAAIRLFESRNQLPNNYVMKVDKASMSLGIEARAPFLDSRVANLAYQLPSELLIDEGNEKKILKSMARRYQLLPDQIIDRRKYGSGIESNWLDQPSEFRDYARETILDTSGWVDELGLRSAMESYFEQGKTGYGFPHPISIFRNLAWRLLILNLWSKSLGVKA